MECAVYDTVYASPHYCTLTLSGNCTDFKRRNLSALKAEGNNFAYNSPSVCFQLKKKKPKQKQSSLQEKIVCRQTHS